MYGYNTHGSESQATCRNIWLFFQNSFYLAISYICTMYLYHILTQLPSNYPYTPQYVPFSPLYLVAFLRTHWIQLVLLSWTWTVDQFHIPEEKWFPLLKPTIASIFSARSGASEGFPPSMLELLTRIQVLAFHSEELTHRHIVRNRNGGVDDSRWRNS